MPPDKEEDSPDINRVVQNAEVLRLVIDAAPSLLSYIGSDFRFRFANRAYSDWFGYKPEDIVGKTLAEVIGAPAFERARPYMETALTGQLTIYEKLMPYTRGGPRYVHTELVPDVSVGGGVQGFVAIITDITARHEAEETLERRENELAALVENSPDIICRFDRELRCIFASPAIRDVLGVPPQAMIGKTHAEMGAPPEMCDVAEASLRRIFATGKPDHISFMLPAPMLIEGTTNRYFEATGVPLIGLDGSVESVMTVSRDVTARRIAEQERALLLAGAAEAALRQRAFLREILYSVSEGKVRLCDVPGDLPEPLSPISSLMELTLPLLGSFRRTVRRIAHEYGLPDERAQDLETAVGEAAMNAVVHAGGGTGRVYARRNEDGSSLIQSWVMDRGAGIGIDLLHRAMLERGYSSAGTLGHGFWIMMRTADRIWLLTSEAGTTMVIQQASVPMEPAWLQDDSDRQGG